MLIKIDSPILGFIDFKSAKGGSKKCVKGKVCGLTCIAKSRVCRIELKGANKAASKWLVSQNTSTDDGPPTMKGRIERGIELYREELKAIEATYAKLQDERDRGSAEWDEAYDAIDAFESANPGQIVPPDLYANLAKAQRYQESIESEAEEVVNKAFAELRGKMLARGDSSLALDIASKVAIDADQQLDTGTIQDELATLNRISGNRVRRLQKVWQDPQHERAYVEDEKGIINVGKGEPRPESRVLWHEFGHLIEVENPSIKAAANDFIQQRRDGSPPKKLNKIVPGAGYEDDEKAYTGDFYHPYLGKFYKDGGTEVISMGLESFRSPQAMRQLYREDPMFFAFMLGVLS
jgi:hypothetical protein